MKTISIITGGGSGLGFSIAKQLVEKGDNVAIIGRNTNRLKKACSQIKTCGKGEIVLFAGDISDEKFVNNMFVELMTKYQINYLFNCAGEARFGKPEDNTLEKITTTFSACLIGLILMSSCAIKYMTEGGTIVNVMSSAALKGNAMESIYCAAKWGARGFSEAIKAYTKGSNIKVVSVYPGGINTPFWTAECGMKPDTSKFMNSDEVAEQIIFSVKERNSMYVGELTVDRK